VKRDAADFPLSGSDGSGIVIFYGTVCHDPDLTDFVAEFLVMK
jgi:hypothetical protein